MKETIQNLMYIAREIKAKRSKQGIQFNLTTSIALQ